MSNIYDIVAKICSDVIRNCEDESVYVKYTCISPASLEEIKENIFNSVPGLFTSKKDFKVKKLTESDLDHELFTPLKACSNKLAEAGDIFSMLTLLRILDEGLETLLHQKAKEFQEESFSVILNMNREATGVGLMPRCSCVWERKHRLSHSYNRLDNFLFNFLLLENTILGEMIDQHYFLKPDTFPDFAEKKKLKIALSPLRIENNFDIEMFTENRVQCFDIVHNEESFDRDNEMVWEKIQRAAENESDIVVFPEMLGNPEMPKYISEKIKSLSEEERKKMPALTILPSYCKKRLNIVTILDRKGDRVCRQCKQNPFMIETSEGSILEGIKANNIINILHYEGIGRIAILICKDFLTTKYMEQLMRCFKLTLIIVPSYSTGSYDFIQSFDLCAHDDCNVIWLNTCAAMQPGKEANFKSVGFVRKRIGRNDDDSQKLCSMPVCEGAFERKCSHDCIYFQTIKGV